MMARLFLTLLLFAGPAWATVEENEVSARLAEDTTKFLERLLGPGRANVFITVEGESSDVQTQTEVTTPILNLDQQGNKTMPGYGAANQNQAPAKVDYFQKDLETSNRKGGFRIRRLRASVVLDKNLPDEAEKAVRRQLPEFLRMDSERGDDLLVLRAPLLAPWKAALLTPEGMRMVLVLGSVLGAGLLIAMIIYFMVLRVTKTLVGELAMHRSNAGLPPAPQLGGLGLEGAGGPLPALGPGGLPSLDEPIDVPAENAGAPLGLGRRFDFLSSRESAEVGELLAKEPPEDLALLFAYLADSNPDLASRIFSALPVALQGEVSTSLVKLNMADPERLAMLESRVKTSIEFGVSGSDRLGRILSRLPPGEREGLLGDLMSKDPAGAENVERSLLPFEKIGSFKPEELRRLIMAVPYQEWGIALRGAEADLVEKVLNELPVGTRNLVQEASQVPQTREKIVECRSKILSHVHALAARGLINLKEGASPELI